ncbi:MAG: hypothetical protein HZA46_00450 [Planctomycetales bacterium]|nr:hypothetical protein [Planctomycetales bacterium]
MRSAAILLGLITGFASPATGKGTTIQLGVEIETPALFARSGAAIPVTWTIHSEQPNVIEGRLHYELLVDGKVRARFESHDLAIGLGDTRFTTLLPGITTDQRTNYVDVKIRFVTVEKVVSLSDRVLRVQPPRLRVFVTAVCDPWASRIADETSALINHLRIEHFHPGDIERAIDTTPAHIAPERLPTEPLGYCGFDLLLLLDEGFSSLRERQLLAILDWVDAGGSVLVRPRGTLQIHHLTFLNELFSHQTDLPPFTLDDKSRLAEFGAVTDARVRLAKRGLGRAGLLSKASEQIDFDSTAWRRTAAWLWKLRMDQTESVLAQGSWNTMELDRELVQNQFGYDRLQLSGKLIRLTDDFEQVSALSPRAIRSGDWLLEKLMPETARVISLPMVGVILGLYLLAVGPGDFFLLKLIRRHKFTFLLFPAVTIGFTYWTVRMSDANLRTNKSLRSLRILDVGSQGKFLRENRFELLFANIEREVVTEARHELFTQLDPRLYRSQLADRSNRGRPQPTARYPGMPGENLLMTSGTEQPALHEGQMPALYRVRQRLGQFTPQINHLLTIAPDRPPSDFDWDSLRPADFADASRRNELGKQLQSHFGTQAIAYLLHGSDVFPLTGDPAWMLRRGEMWPQPGGSPQPVSPAAFLRDVSARAPAGLFTFASRISPTGGDNLEDLTILDPSDRDAWLLIVVVETTDDIFVYRKSYD